MDLRRFEDRKADHLRLSLDPRIQAQGFSGFDSIRLEHDALPELQLREVSLLTKFWSYEAASPLFVSSMTAGHSGGEALNLRLAKTAASQRWPMGVGSQRRELTDPAAAREWQELRKAAPSAFFFSNLGLAQLIRHGATAALKLVDSLQANALIIHLNALQEALQVEGTPEFKGGLKALTELAKQCRVPIVVKETGCGIGPRTAQRLLETGIHAIDVSGLGGTHWGRLEGARAKEQNATRQALAAESFRDWGIPTLDCLQNIGAILATQHSTVELWASGGIANGVDAAKCIALGAHKVGFAKQALAAAQTSDEALATWMEQMEFELQVALFATGSASPQALRETKKWQKI